MKRVLKISDESDISKDEFDKAWEAQFGEPSTKVYDSFESFEAWMKEVSEFEVSSNQTV